MRLLGLMPSKLMLHLDKRGLLFDTKLDEEMFAKRAGMPVPTINLQLPCDLATIPRSEDLEALE